MGNGWRRALTAVACAIAPLAGTIATPVEAPVAVASTSTNPPFIPYDADWLTSVNYYRAMAGLPAVTEDTSLSVGALLHSCYMLYNGISHNEVVGKQGYSAAGAAAGENGNVAVSSVYNDRSRAHVELWMTGPFHAVGILRPNLKTVGFGKCDLQGTPLWHSGATLDVLHGLSGSDDIAAPIVWPGDGTTTFLNRFIVESPDPLPSCGYVDANGKDLPAGLPLIAMMPEAPLGATATITGPKGAIPTCALTAQNTTDVAQAILDGNNVVVAIPKDPLAAGTYHVTVTTSARTVSWSFTVDPAAEKGETPSNATPTPTSSSVGFTAINPHRLVDTREGIGGTRILANQIQRLQITGDVIPAGATAVSANLTVTGTMGNGYLTAWNCSPTRPVIASLNYGTGETIPNGATIPLDADGGICVFSPATTDLIVDANGYYSTTGVGRFSTVSPVRLMDTRSGLGGSGRLAAGQTVQLQVGGTNGVPVSAVGVTLNVTSVDPAEAGFVTVYPCDRQRPFTANLNPQPGKVKPNLVVSPLAADGTVCLYSLHDVDLVVDLTGYLGVGSDSTFTATVPFRFTDTRDKIHPEVNDGTSGNTLSAGQTIVIPIAGQRGVPTSARAVSVNIAAVGADKAGFITAWPCGPRPTTASLNYEAGAAVSNGAQLPLSSSGQLCIYTMSSVHVIVDVNGWWS